jgi:hypothetical protein
MTDGAAASARGRGAESSAGTGEQASLRFTAVPAAEAARTTEPELGARPDGATFTRTQIS